MSVVDGPASLEVFRHRGHGLPQSGEDLYLLEIDRPAGSPAGLTESIGGQVREASLGGGERLALALSVHGRSG